MKILFITYDFYPSFGANSLIIYNLSQAFISLENEVHILSLKASDVTEEDEVWQNIFIHRIINSFDKKQVMDYLHKFKFLSAVRLAGSILEDRFDHREFLKKHWIYYPVQRLSNILSKFQIDTVINVCYPFESCLPVLTYLKKNMKTFHWMIYMQDPFATNYYYLDKYPKDELLNFQNSAFQLTDKIIGTTSIINELQELNFDIPLQKFKILNFPIVTKPQITQSEDDILFQRHYVNCVYVGKFNKATRNPEILFQLFGLLKKDRIRLHIIGEDRSDWESLLPENASNIFFHGMQTKEISTNAELNANILVNIGNTMNNQLPSKIFEYISTGKPIVNLCKIEDCPTLEYMNRYPHCMNIMESRIDRKTLQKLRNFCIRYRNVVINYKYIRKRFYDCTIEYVSSEFLKECKEITEENQQFN